LSHDDFKTVLQTEQELYHTINYIRQQNLTNFNIKLRKKTLSCYDDKRYLLDPIRSVPYGYDGPDPPPISYYNVDFNLDEIQENIVSRNRVEESEDGDNTEMELSEVDEDPEEEDETRC